MEWLEALLPDCVCCAEPEPAMVGWATPGVTGQGVDDAPGRPSADVRALTTALARVRGTDPAGLTEDLALVDLRALLEAREQLRVLTLSRMVDAQTRRLYALDDEPSLPSWVRRRFEDAPRREVALSKTIRRFPHLHAQVDAGAVSVEAASRTAASLSKVVRHLDRPDGLVDGLDGEEVIAAVVRNTVSLVAGSVCGLADDPRLDALVAETEQIVGSGGSQRDRVEAAFTVLAREVPLSELRRHLAEQQDALLPSALEDSADRAHEDRGIELQPRFGGGGGRAVIDADSELYELLWTLIAAEARRDAESVRDHALHAEARRQPLADEDLAREALTRDPLGDDVEVLCALQRPRSRRQRSHDALRNLLQRYLDADLAGSHDKAPVAVTVTCPVERLEGLPGALPATGASGQRIAPSQLRSWWCNAAITAVVLTRGLIPLGATHTQRTLTALERKASLVQHDGRCDGLRCCVPFDPLTDLVPHHVQPYAVLGRTSISETVWACPQLHHDLHHGRTVQLRSGRWLTERGWVAGPDG